MNPDPSGKFALKGCRAVYGCCLLILLWTAGVCGGAAGTQQIGEAERSGTVSQALAMIIQYLEVLPPVDPTDLEASITFRATTDFGPVRAAQELFVGDYASSVGAKTPYLYRAIEVIMTERPADFELHAKLLHVGLLFAKQGNRFAFQTLEFGINTWVLLLLRSHIPQIRAEAAKQLHQFEFEDPIFQKWIVDAIRIKMQQAFAAEAKAEPYSEVELELRKWMLKYQPTFLLNQGGSKRLLGRELLRNGFLARVLRPRRKAPTLPVSCQNVWRGG